MMKDLVSNKKIWVIFVLILIFLLIFGQSERLSIRIKFFINRQQMECVAEEMKSQKFEKEFEEVELTHGNEKLSVDGCILVQNNNEGFKILFYDKKGIFEEFSGFVYSENDEKIKNGDLGISLWSNNSEVYKLDTDWYWVRSN